MNPSTLKLSLKKQRQINRNLMEKLRAETMLSNALSGLAWKRKDQTDAALKKVCRALELKQQITNTPQNITRFYPTGSKSA